MKVKVFIERLFLILFGIFISIILVEFILRIFVGPPIKFSEYPKFYLISTEYGYDLKENFWPPQEFYVENSTFPIWTNEIGCFDKPVNQNSKILLIGDSFTWGFTPFDDKFGTILEKKLKVGILKCGVSGYGTIQSFIKSKRILSKIPSISVIIYNYFLNDLDDDFLYPHFTVIDGYLSPLIEIYDFNSGQKFKYSEQKLKRLIKSYKIRKWLNDHSYLYNIIKKPLKNLILGGKLQKETFDRSYPWLIFGIGKYQWVKNFLELHFSNIANFKTLKVNFFMTIIPTKEQVYPELLTCNEYVEKFITNKSMISVAKTDEEIIKPQKILRSFLEKEHIPYIDFLPLFRFYRDHEKKCFLNPEKDLYWKYDGHWNVKGNHLAGLLLARFLIKENLVKLANKEEIIAEVERDLINEFGKLPPEEIWKASIFIPKK